MVVLFENIRLIGFEKNRVKANRAIGSRTT
jgi:hypothetical protein